MEQKQQLIEARDLIKVMGAIIRTLDENNAHSEYWLNDGDYVPAANEITNGIPESDLRQLHVLKVMAINKDLRAMVQIESEYYEQTISIPFNNTPGNTQPAVETAEKYLVSKGFKLIGRSIGKGHRHYLVAKNFLKLK